MFRRLSNSSVQHVTPAVYPLPAGGHKPKLATAEAGAEVHKYHPPGFLITSFKNDISPLLRRLNPYFNFNTFATKIRLLPPKGIYKKVVVKRNI